MDTLYEDLHTFLLAKVTELGICRLHLLRWLPWLKVKGHILAKEPEVCISYISEHEDGGNNFFRNTGNHLHVYTASQSIRPRAIASQHVYVRTSNLRAACSLGPCLTNLSRPCCY
jgi:hypothetical protein